MASSGTVRSISERLLILLVGAVQFVNVLDFMMVMPLGPDFARALHIPASRLGWVAGSYALAAAVAGIGGAFFLDRWDRRWALAAAMGGLGVGTLAGGLATGFASLLASRLVAGLFGGPATSLAFSIIADAVPEERRGRAMGAVMGAFSVASVLGVPAGLWLAEHAGWRAPFLAVGSLGLLITSASFSFLPPMRGHLLASVAAVPLPVLLGRPEVRASYVMTAVTMMGGFILLPNLSAYFQFNLGYPRHELDVLYVLGGLMSFFAMRLAGRLVDRFGSFRVGTASVVLLEVVLFLGFYRGSPRIPVVAVFLALMLCLNFRNVSYNTLVSRVPRRPERARFLSLQSAVQHAASSLGAVLSSVLLADQGGRLIGMPRVAAVAMTSAALLPFLLWRVERRVARPS